MSQYGPKLIPSTSPFIGNSLNGQPSGGFTVMLPPTPNSGQKIKPNLPPINNKIDGYILKGFSEFYYNRIIVNPIITNVGNILNEVQITVSVYNAHFDSRNLQTIDSINATGLSINATPETYGPLSGRNYTITVGTIGPSTIDAEFRFNFNPTENVSTFVQGVRTVFFPYVPKNASETLSMFNASSTSINGTIRQKTLRSNQKREFNLTCFINRDNFKDLENLVYGWRDRVWGLPVWLECQITTVALNDGDTVLPTVAPISNLFRVGQSILLTNYRDFFIGVIEEINPNEIVLETPIVGFFPIGSMFSPIVDAKIRTNPEINTNGYTGQVRVTFELDQYETPLTSNPIEFLGKEVYLRKSETDGNSITSRYTTSLPEVDFDVGVSQRISVWSHIKKQRGLRFILENRAELEEFKNFIYRRQGLSRPFYYPSFIPDIIVLNTSVITDTLITENTNIQIATTRDVLYFSLKDGSYRFAKVEDFVVELETVTMTLTESLNINANEIQYVSYMDLVRLVTPSTTIEYIGDNVTQCQFEIVEV